MDDTTAVAAASPTLEHPVPTETKEVVSTHVLVEPGKVDRLRELSKRTRIAQSEYLREAVDDLLSKYHRLPAEE
jgi:hypothetical protein